MRTAFRLGLVASLGAALVAMPALAGSAMPVSAPMGMVLQADHAMAGADITAGGATIYDGDTLQTDTGGTLRVRLGGAQAYFLQNTIAQVHPLDNGFSANLRVGTIVVSAAEGQTFQVISDGATIRPAGPEPTVAQVSWINANELVLTSRRGALQVSLDDEVKTIESGSSYRMEIAPDDGPGPQGTGAGQPPQHSGRNRRRAFFFILGGITAGTAIGIWRATVSPSAP